MVQSPETSAAGSFAAAPTDRTVVNLKTGRIGLMRLDLQAPVLGGHLNLAKSSSDLEIVLDLGQVRTGNPIIQSAMRSLVGTGQDSHLVFQAAGAADDLLRFEGQAQAGDVVVPMEVTAVITGSAPKLKVELTGWARFTDVHLPLPGMSRVDSIEVDVNTEIPFVEK